MKNGLNTFTIGFEDKNHDESFAASKIADFLGTNHTEIILEPKDLINLIPKLPDIYSEPFADSSQLPTSLICKEAKKSGLSVVLTGDGGDEIFGGYVRHFLGPRVWSKVKLVPYPIRSLMGNLMNFFPSEIIENNNLLKIIKSPKSYTKYPKDLKKLEITMIYINH